MLTQRQIGWAAMLSAALGVLLVTYAFAGSYTVTTTPDQDAALAEMAKAPQRVVPGKAPVPPLTPQSLVQGFVDRSLSGQVARIQRAKDCAKVTDPAAKQRFGCPK